MNKCLGISPKGKPCRFQPLKDELFCNAHLYMKNIPEQDRKDIANNTTKTYKACKTCGHWHNRENVVTCIDCFKNEQNRQQARKVKKVTCKGITGDMKPCRIKKPDDCDFCEDHLYQKNYTEEQMKNLTKCSGCKKAYYLVEHKTCDKCRNRSDKNREKLPKVEKKESPKKEVIQKKKCKGLDKDRNECICYQRKNMTTCYNHNYMENFTEEDIQDIKNNGGKFKLCSLRGKYPCYKWHNTEFKTCPKCRERGRKKDFRRRNSESRKKWNKENRDKIVSYWIKSRAKNINKLGIDEYRRINAENAKKWREKNKEKIKQLNLDRQTNKKLSVNTYKYRAKIKNIEWNLTNDEAINLMSQECYYCGQFDIIDEVSINGIDRKNNNIGYIPSNVVSCCEMCNIMKGEIKDDKIYLKKIYHILSRLGLTEELIAYPDCFKNYRTRNYGDHLLNTKKREIESEIIDIDYYIIKSLDCYLCGKETTNEHINGIDRIDNEIGYIDGNCLPCCGDCNYMKNKYELYKVIQKFYLTYCNHNDVKHIFCETFISYLCQNLHTNTIDRIEEEFDIIEDEDIFIHKMKQIINNKINYISKVSSIKKRLFELKEQIDNIKNEDEDNNKEYEHLEYEYYNLIEQYNIDIDEIENPKNKKMTEEELKIMREEHKKRTGEEMLKKYNDPEYIKNRSLELKQKYLEKLENMNSK